MKNAAFFSLDSNQSESFSTAATDHDVSHEIVIANERQLPPTAVADLRAS